MQLFFFTVFSLSSFKGKIGNKKSFGGTGEMLWGAGRSPLVSLTSYKPCGFTFDLAFLRITFYMGANKNVEAGCLKSFEPQSVPLNPSCASLTKRSLIEHLGTYNIFSLNK